MAARESDGLELESEVPMQEVCVGAPSGDMEDQMVTDLLIGKLLSVHLCCNCNVMLELVMFIIYQTQSSARPPLVRVLNGQIMSNPSLSSLQATGISFAYPNTHTFADRVTVFTVTSVMLSPGSSLNSW